jgi:hypothetical protein
LNRNTPFCTSVETSSCDCEYVVSSKEHSKIVRIDIELRMVAHMGFQSLRRYYNIVYKMLDTLIFVPQFLLARD